MDLRNAIAAVRPLPAVYVLASRDLSYLYKGASRNLRERLNDHLAGRVSRTKNRRPLMLICHQYCLSYSDALAHERLLKSGQGRQWLRAFARGQTVPPKG